MNGVRHQRDRSDEEGSEKKRTRKRFLMMINAPQIRRIQPRISQKEQEELKKTHIKNRKNDSSELKIKHE
jgi:hypothetical protein